MNRPLIALSIAALAAPLLAQDWKGMGRLQGRVTDPDGNGVAGASVKLDCPSRGGGATVETDKKGNWAFLGLAGCSWNVEIKAEGFLNHVRVVNMVSDQVRMSPIEVKLEKPKGPPPELLAAVNAGDAAFDAKNWALARESYEKVLALRPDLGPQVYQKLAQAYAGEKNTAKSIEYLELSITAAPARMDLRFAAAQIALKADLTEKALAILEGIDDAQVENGDGYFDVAVDFLNKKDPANTVTFFTKALAKDPTIADAYYWRGRAFLQLQKLNEVKADLKKYVEMAPDGEHVAAAKGLLEQLK
jgi:tetratricopeptide (TPR) repeat protein